MFWGFDGTGRVDQVETTAQDDVVQVTSMVSEQDLPLLVHSLICIV